MEYDPSIYLFDFHEFLCFFLGLAARPWRHDARIMTPGSELLDVVELAAATALGCQRSEIAADTILAPLTCFEELVLQWGSEDI